MQARLLCMYINLQLQKCVPTGGESGKTELANNPKLGWKPFAQITFDPPKPQSPNPVALIRLGI
jgi:hypothetical protein